MKRLDAPAPHRARTTRPSLLRTAAALVVASGLVVGLGACASGSSSGVDANGNVTLTLWDTDTRPDRTANIKTLIQMFEKENPTITIEYLGLPTDSYMQKISTAIATNSTPDLLTPKSSDIGALEGQGALAPLDDLFASAGLASQIDPGMLASSKAAAPDGKLYLTPATSLADVIYYRPDLFAAAGIAPPATWDDFYAAADKLTDKSSGKFGYTLRGGDGYFSPLVATTYPEAGISDFFRADGTSTLNDPKIVAATQRYVDLYNRDTAQSDLTAEFKTVVANFDNGGSAMLTHSIGSYPTHVTALGADKVAAVVPFPSDSGATVLTGRMTTGFAMFKASSHQDAAWKFLQFTMSQAGDSFWAQKSGYIPGNLAAAAEPWVAENQPLQAAVAASSLPGVKTLQQPYYLPDFSAITNTQSMPQWQLVLQGQLSVKDFLDTVAGNLTASQQKYTAQKK